MAWYSSRKVNYYEGVDGDDTHTCVQVGEFVSRWAVKEVATSHVTLGQSFSSQPSSFLIAPKRPDLKYLKTYVDTYLVMILAVWLGIFI